MEDLILSESNSVEENILAIIEFVKQVEKEHGLSDEQIVCKYTYNYCLFFAFDIVFTALRVMFGNLPNIDVIKIESGNEFVKYHEYLTFKKDNNEIYYFDILGKKTKSQVDDFMKSDFWRNMLDQPWVEEFLDSNEYEDVNYVYNACKQHIKPHESNINN